MKSKIQSLLGIEMSLNGWEFKPILLLLGVLLFIALAIPLLIVYGCLYIKFSLINYLNNIKKEYKKSKNIGLKGV